MKIPCTGLAALIAVSCAWSAQAAGSASHPNIVFILADDIGMGDLGRFHEVLTGTPPLIPTPNLDRLCREGMMFTDARLPASLCAPNRFSLMTGSYPYRSRPAGTWNRTTSSGFHFGREEGDRLENPHLTIGSVLQKAGYRTAYFGKMHLGGDFFDSEGRIVRNLPQEELEKIDFSRRFENGLLEHGFDYTFVTPDGIQGPVYMWFENDQFLPISRMAERVEGLAAEPASVLRRFAKGDTVGYGEMIAPGWGDSRFDTSEHGLIMGHFAREFLENHVRDHPEQPFLLYYATPAIHTPLTPEKDLRGASQLDARADFVMDLDRQVGRLLETLDRLGLADRTMVIFTSDNGGGTKGGEKTIAAGQHPNAHFRSVKGSIYEGGVRVPFLWKSLQHPVVPTGLVCSQQISAIDWIPTVIEIVGGTIAEDQHMDSTSIVPLLTSNDPDREKPVRLWHFHRGDVNDTRNGVRMDDAQGRWILLQATEKRPLELYNLTTDISQTKNLVEGYHRPGDLPSHHSQKDRVQTMTEWLRTYGHPSSPRSMPVPTALRVLSPGN
jgi:arylsulfatase A